MFWSVSFWHPTLIDSQGPPGGGGPPGTPIMPSPGGASPNYVPSTNTKTRPHFHLSPWLNKHTFVPSPTKSLFIFHVNIQPHLPEVKQLKFLFWFLRFNQLQWKHLYNDESNRTRRQQTQRESCMRFEVHLTRATKVTIIHMYIFLTVPYGTWAWRTNGSYGSHGATPHERITRWVLNTEWRFISLTNFSWNVEQLLNFSSPRPQGLGIWMGCQRCVKISKLFLFAGIWMYNHDVSTLECAYKYFLLSSLPPELS